MANTYENYDLMLWTSLNLSSECSC
jgi:hypothetical protein